VPIPEGRELLRDIHAGICGHHAAPRTLVGNTFRQGFYWPTAVADASEIVRTCEGCQFYAANPTCLLTSCRPPHYMAFRRVGAGHRRAPAKGARGLHPLVGRD
jgi:hypothetical protein